jgi:hypothetical protein
VRIENSCADIPSAPSVPEFAQQQLTDGLSFVGNSSRFKPEQQPSQGAHFSRCTTLAQRVQFPLQWKEARHIRDGAI